MQRNQAGNPTIKERRETFCVELRRAKNTELFMEKRRKIINDNNKFIEMQKNGGDTRVLFPYKKIVIRATKRQPETICKLFSPKSDN